MQDFVEDTVNKSRFRWSSLRVLGQKVARAILAGCVFVTIASSAVAQSLSSRVSIDAFGEVYVTALAAPVEQTRVFVYRIGQAPNASPINIYLNGQYHASLLRGGYTEFCAAPGAVNIKAALDDASRLHTSKLDAGQRLELKAGQTNFLKVDESSSPAIGLLSGTAAQTKAEIESTRRQIHTISRAKAALTCGQPAAAAAVMTPPPAPKPPVPREYALGTDALFEFGKAEIRASGFNAIESLVQRLLQDFSSVERIRVVGFTDPIGSAAFNKKLSQDRADVVARQIVSRKIPIERGIEAEGRGPIELVKSGCGNTPTPENKFCHAPNRRVMVVITGARR